MNTVGENFKEPSPSNYLGQYDRDGNRIQSEGVSLKPFPLNRYFKSEPVLSEELREVIWAKVMKDAMSVQEVSAQLGVEMRRVAAVVRLKEVEKAWVQSVSF